jgi:maltooligosyltrehalose trehalohydrolase
VNPAAVDGRRFLAYLQSHDQVGNRAQGDRISASITPAQQASGAALYLTSAFTPMIFMGEEWGATTPFQFFTDFEDPQMGPAVTEGRRAEFAAHGWSADEVPDPQDEVTYRRSQLDWAERDEGQHARMLTWYRSLLAVRRNEFQLTDGRLDAVQVDFDEDAAWLVMRRGNLRTVVNFAGSSRWHVPLEGEVGEVLLAWEPRQTKPQRGGLHLPPQTAAVVRMSH